MTFPAPGSAHVWLSWRPFQWPWLSLLLVLWGIRAQGALPPVREQFYGLEHGLPHRQVNCLWQDRQGFLWIGTESGLCRFDGYTFERANPWSAATSAIWALAETQDGLLWMGTPMGLRCLNLHTGQERTFPHPDRDGTTPTHQRIHALLVTRRGTLYVGTEAGWLLRYTGKGQFVRVVRLPTIATSGLTSLLGVSEDAHQQLWLSTEDDGTVYQFAPATGRLQAYPAAKGTSAAAPSIVRQGGSTIAVDAAGRVYASQLYRQRPAVYQAAQHSFKLLPVPDQRPPISRYFKPVLLAGPHGILWSAWSSGTLGRYVPTTGVWQDLSPILRTRALNVRCLLADRQDGVWAGTSNGLVRFTDRSDLFTTALTQSVGVPLEQRYSLRGLALLPDGRLVIGGYQGVHVLDSSLRTAPRPLPDWRPRDGEAQSVYAYGILPDSAGRGAWLSTEGGGLAWLNLHTGRYSFFTGARDQHGQPVWRTMRTIARGADGRLWLGTYEGVYWFTPATQRFHHLTSTRWPEVASLNCYALLEADGQLWVGAKEGLYAFDPTTGHVRQRLRPGLVRALWWDARAHVLWLGTSGGLAQLTRPGNRLRLFGAQAGLSNEVVNALLPDALGRLWVSTENGLNVVDRRTGQLQSFGFEDGLADAEFNHGSALRLPGGTLLFGSINGLTRVRPQPVATPIPAPLLLTALTYDDARAGKVRTRRFGLGQPYTLQLGPEDQFFSLSYALGEYAAPERHRFAYRLVGLETRWNEVGTAHTLRYTRLPAGSYTLLLRAAGTAGRWQPAQTVLHVVVQAPLYARWWFVVLTISAGASLLYGLYRVRLRRLRHLEQLRTRIAADLHDEVGAWLTRVSMQAELVRAGPVASDKQQRQLEGIAEASRQAIATMSDVVWAVDARNDALGNLLDRMQQQADALLTPYGITYTFTQQGLDPTHLLAPDFRQHVFLIYKEALHNLVRHSAATQVGLFVGHRDGAFWLEIHDDGPAREPARPGSGQGLRNMQLRARSLGATLTVEKGVGYTVRLRTTPV